jgi:O-antigen ligase
VAARKSDRRDSEIEIVRRSAGDRAAWYLVAATMLVPPLFVSLSGKDAFRFPKELIFLAAAVILGAIILCAALLSDPLGRDARWPPGVRAVLVACLLWSALTAVLSANIALSSASLLYATAAAMIFTASFLVLQGRRVIALTVVLAPAVINAVVAMLQRLDLWTPFHLESAPTPHTRTIALLGNTNDVGMFLTAPAIVAAALTVVSRRRVVPAVITGVLLGGIVASETVGAIVATGAALFTLAFALRRRATVVIAAVVIVGSAIFIRVSPQRWVAAEARLSEAAHGNLDRLLSGRVLPFYAAWRMFARHPVFGVGPGAFRFEFFDEKIATEIAHPELLGRHIENYGEVHNEFLQVLSETGLPGLGLFIAALAIVARTSRRKPDEGSPIERRFTHRVGLPLAVGIAVLCLSAFPFRIAAATGSILFLTAAALAWSHDAIA